MSKTVRCSEARSRVFSAVSFPRDAAQLALSHAATLGEYIYTYIHTVQSIEGLRLLQRCAACNFSQCYASLWWRCGQPGLVQTWSSVEGGARVSTWLQPNLLRRQDQMFTDFVHQTRQLQWIERKPGHPARQCSIHLPPAVRRQCHHTIPPIFVRCVSAIFVSLRQISKPGPLAAATRTAVEISHAINFLPTVDGRAKCLTKVYLSI